MTTTPTPSPAPPGLPRWALGALLAGAALIVALLVVILVLVLRDDTPNETTAPEGTDTFTVSGTVTLTSADILTGGGTCFGDGGYSDLQPGAQVVVRDAQGATVAAGSLGPGARPKGERYRNVMCEFPFTVEGVPSGGDLYSVEVGSRGEVTFREADAGSLALTLG